MVSLKNESYHYGTQQLMINGQNFLFHFIFAWLFYFFLFLKTTGITADQSCKLVRWQRLMRYVGPFNVQVTNLQCFKVTQMEINEMNALFNKLLFTYKTAISIVMYLHI